MAEALPDEVESYGDTDNVTELSESFERAATHLQTLFSRLDTKTILSLYALYKQSTVGPCDIPQPGWFQMQNRQKWDAWKQLKDLPPGVAMQRYVDKICELDPDWSGGKAAKAAGWVAVSSMPDTDEALADKDKTAVDWAREGDVDRVLQTASPASVDRLDAEGMGLIHWAADRGHAGLVGCLLSALSATVDLRDADGQTALHYAAGCGHADVVRVLLANGADRRAVDAAGASPLDLAADTLVREMLGAQ